MNKITSFVAPKRILMGPGPSDVSERVLQAMAQPTIGHLDPQFAVMMDELKAMLRYAFMTENALTIPVSAPGSAGMETAFVNLLEPGEKVIVCQNGVFGGRMKENAERCGAEVVHVQDDWGKPVSVDKVEQALNNHPDAKAVAFVHAETSTGVRSDAEAICALAKQHDCLTIVDAVTALAGIELRVDDWQIDAIYSGTQKCLSCPPGLSPVSFSAQSEAVIRNRGTKVQSWFLDLSLVMDYWDGSGGRVYHHTAPVNAMYGLHESLVMLQEQGLESSWEKHARVHTLLKTELESLGFEFLVTEEDRLPQLNAIVIPGGVDDKQARATFLNKYNLEIGAGLGPMAGKVWRVGLMGESCTENHVDRCLEALKSIL